MKKEKKVRTYQRRTKSGKIITVRAHTASYEAAEKAKEAAKKKGAGDELSSKVKKGEEWKLPMDEFLKKLKEERAEKKWNDEVDKSWKSEDEKPKKKSEKKTEKKTSAKKATKKRTVGTGTNGPEPKKKATIKKTATKADTSEPAFTRDEFKEWYRGTGSAADKKVAKALRKQLGRSDYRKFEDEAIDNYTSRGHLSMFKRVSGGSFTSAKTKNASVSRTSAKDKGSIGKGSKHYSDEGSTRKNVAKEVALGSMSREKAYAITGLKKYAPKVTTSIKASKDKKVPKQITPEQLKKEAARGSTSIKSAFNIGGATYGKSEYDLYRKGDKEYAVNRKTGKLATDSMTAKIMAFRKKVLKDNKDGVAVKYKKLVGIGTNGPEPKKSKTSVDLKKEYESALADEKKQKRSSDRKQAKALYEKYGTSHKEVAAFMKESKRKWSWDKERNSFTSARLSNGSPMRGIATMSLQAAIRKMMRKRSSRK